ncbi:MAG: hypothetical protein KAS95_08120 [Candidatus Heimdallarchaeota archaeon]|nr:hypothetical protein [Candidatus Heimdallarchaeota archaeon]
MEDDGLPIGPAGAGSPGPSGPSGPVGLSEGGAFDKEPAILAISLANPDPPKGFAPCGGSLEGLGVEGAADKFGAPMESPEGAAADKFGAAAEGKESLGTEGLAIGLPLSRAKILFSNEAKASSILSVDLTIMEPMLSINFVTFKIAFFEDAELPAESKPSR